MVAPVMRVIRRVVPVRGVQRTRILEELFRNVESGSLVVHMPSLGASFEIDCRSDILRRVLVSADYEPDVVELIRQTVDPNLDAIDIGANIGLFTVLLSSLVSRANRVLAIEPTVGALKYLRANLVRNSAANVIVFPGVAAGARGTFTLSLIPGMEEYSSLVSTTYAEGKGKRCEQMSVAGDTLDNLSAQHSLKPGFLKIDAEGAEYQVLSGCQAILRNERPVILYEEWPDDMIVAAGGTPGTVAAFLESHAYVVTRCSEYEMLAIPSEKMPTPKSLAE
jgi:FkbM family methyltransferase